MELIASGLEKGVCDEALAIASNSAYSVLQAAGVILPEDVQRAVAAEPYEIEREKLRSETRALFATIWRDTRRPARCELDIRWLHYPIPEDNAAKWLGVHVHTDLEFTETIKFNFQDTVAPNDIFRGAFCGNMSFSEYKRSLDRVSQEKGPASVPSGPYGTHGVYRREYSFPVFNEDFTRAVLTFSQEFFYVRTHTFEGSVSAVLYVKQNGVWKMQDQDELAHWE
jgi:hypothetical protein